MNPPSDPTQTSEHPFGFRYQVQRTLGKGAFGQVVLAKDQTLGRFVAIKQLLPLAQSDATQRFEREAAAAALVRHRNVVGLFAAGLTPAGAPFLVFEYVPGEPLDRVLAQKEQGFSEEETLKAVKQLLEGLAAMHRAEVIHRDLKPANILCHKDGRLMIADLGLASMAEQTTLTATGSLVGTLSYMAPELFQGHTAGPGTDLFAVGCVGYEMLKGKRFQENTSDLMQREDGELPHWKTLQASGPGGTWLAKLLARRPEDRFSSAEEALSHGEQIFGENPAPVDREPPPIPRPPAGGRPLEATSPGLGASKLRTPPKHSNRPSSRRPRMLWLPLLVLGACFLFWIFSSPNSLPPPDSPPLDSRGEVHVAALEQALSPLPDGFVGKARAEHLRPLLDPTFPLRLKRLYMTMLQITNSGTIAAVRQVYFHRGYRYFERLIRFLMKVETRLRAAVLMSDEHKDFDDHFLREGTIRLHEDLMTQFGQFLFEARHSDRLGKEPLECLLLMVLTRYCRQEVPPPLLSGFLKGLDTESDPEILAGFFQEAYRNADTGSTSKLELPTFYEFEKSMRHHWLEGIKKPERALPWTTLAYLASVQVELLNRTDKNGSIDLEILKAYDQLIEQMMREGATGGPEELRSIGQASHFMLIHWARWLGLEKQVPRIENPSILRARWRKIRDFKDDLDRRRKGR